MVENATWADDSPAGIVTDAGSVNFVGLLDESATVSGWSVDATKRRMVIWPAGDTPSRTNVWDVSNNKDGVVVSMTSIDASAKPSSVIVHPHES